jgi:hypothetical protein
MNDWMKIGIAVWIAGIITYLVVMHTGTGEGKIEPETVYVAFLAIFATKIVDFVYGKVKKKKSLT